MASTIPLARFDRALHAFISSRRTLGRTYLIEAYTLGRLRAFLARAGATELTEPLFERWRFRSATLSNATHVREQGIVHRFCRYRRRSEPRAFLPDPASFVRLKPYALPMILEAGHIARLLRACAPRAGYPHLRYHRAVLRIALILLYTAGLRRGELLRLTLDDVDLHHATLAIRDSKFHKSRWVPLSISAASELQAFLRRRREAGINDAPSATLLTTRRGAPYNASNFLFSFHLLCRRAGVLRPDGKPPRVHDLRHSFAVGALLRWYREESDVQTELPRLAMYMGHVSIQSTAYYLRLMPAVIEHASQRFERSFGSLLRESRP